MTPPRRLWSAKDWALVTALVLSAIFWLLAWHWSTAQSIVAIWIRADTFAHGFVIVPITAWMIWGRRHAVAALSPRPNFLALPLLAIIGFGWLLGQLAGAGVVQQFGLVLMLQVLVWAILGNSVAWALAFPLFFLLLGVPFGEFLERPLMEYTASFIVFALRLSGIPVFREGLSFTIPSGSWSVVEACSGLRYLIASLTLCLPYAYLTYRSYSRRAIFIALSVIVPIIANWVRAYLIVMIGHLSSMKYAVGIDHLIYGWLFFGLVMTILFWIGSHWREDLATHQTAPGSVAAAQQGKSSPGAILLATLAAAVIVAVWPVVAARLEGTGPYQAPQLQAPPLAGGWQPVAGRLTDWTPRFARPRAQIDQAYAKDAARAGLFIGYYRSQREQSQLITSQNMLVRSNDAIWGSIGEIRRALVINNEEIPIIEAQLRGPSTRLLVWRWYWVDGQYTVNQYWAKLLQAKSMLLGRGDDGAVVIVYTELDTGRDAAAGRLQDFVNAMLPAITLGLDNAR